MKKISIFLLLCMLLQTDNAFAARYYMDQSSLAMNVSFGEQLDKYSDSFPEFSETTTTLGRFLEIRETLPDEVDIVEPYEIKGETEFYVSPNGDDENPGTIDKPVKTVNRAIELVSRLKKSLKNKNTVIYLRGGAYTIDSPIEINGDNWNGGGNSALMISAYNNEKVNIGGGASLKGSDVQKVTQDNTDSETYTRIPESVRDNIYFVDYNELGMEEMPGFGTGWKTGSVPSFFINSQQQSMARYPNGEEDGVEEVIRTGMPNNVGYYPPGGATEDSIFIPIDKTVFSWKDTGRIGVKGSFSNPWSVTYSFPKLDKETQTLSSRSWCTNGWGINTILIYASAGPSHFYYYNALEALDLNGEWMADDDNKRLYFSPTSELKNSDVIEFGVNDVDSCFDISNTKNVIINGLNISFVKNGVYCKDSKQVVVQNSSIYNCIAHGMDILRSKKCGITTSKINNVGTGVGIYKYNDNYTASKFNTNDVVPDRNFVMNSYIDTTSLDGIALQSDSMGCVVSHNCIVNTIGCGINNSGYWHIIEYNEFASNSLQGVEGGVIYNNGGSTLGGHHIRNNYFHDVRAPLFGGLNGSSCGAIGTDDLGDGQFIYNNIFENLKASASGAHDGDEHIVMDNVFVNCKTSFAGSSQYFNQPRLEKALLKLPSSIFPSNASDYINSQFARVFPERAAKLKWITELQQEYQKNPEEFLKSKKYEVLGAEMGIFLINNRCVNTPLPNLPDYGFEVVVNDKDILSHPSEIPTLEGQYKNVISNNETLDNIDITQCCNYDRIGPLTDLNINSGTKVNVLYPGNSSEPIYSDKLNISWLKVQNSEYYRVTVAYDEAFNHIAYCEDVHSENVSISLEGDLRSYWYKIEAYSNSKLKGKIREATAYSDIYKVDYKSTYEPIVDGEVYYGTPKIDGIKDEVYNSSGQIIIDTAYNKAGAADIKKPFNKVTANYAWDDTYLYVYADVSDSEVMSAGTEYVNNHVNAWQNDVVEMYLNDNKFSFDAFGIKLFGEDKEDNAKLLPFAEACSVVKNGGNVISDLSDVDKGSIAPGFIYKDSDGYAIEAKLPLKEIYGEMFNGKTIILSIQNNDLVDASNSSAYYNKVENKQFILRGGPDEVKMSFEDVELTNWYYKSVNYMYKKKLVAGTDNKTFKPYDNMTVGMFVTILARINEEQLDENSLNPYDAYINWAEKNGILRDVFAAVPSADKLLTREEAAALLYNFAMYKEKIFVFERVNELKDMSDASEWSKEAVDKLYRSGIISGADNCFNFKNNISRAEVCTILYNYINSEDGKLIYETEGVTN